MLDFFFFFYFFFTSSSSPFPTSEDLRAAATLLEGLLYSYLRATTNTKNRKLTAETPASIR